MFKAIFIGNLGSDTEERFTATGSSLVSFRVAVNGRRRGPDGEWQEHTDWIRVRVGGRQAEYAKRLRKGSRVHVIGTLEVGQYTSREGEVRTSLDVYADEVTNLSPRDELGDTAEAERPAAAAAAPAKPATSGAAPADSTADELEDLPF